MTLSALGTAPLRTACSGAVGGAPQTGLLRWSPYLSRRCHFLAVHISLLILLTGFVKQSSAQLDPVRNFCRRWGHQTAVIDRKLYIDGGFMNYNPLSQYPTNYTNTGLHYHDLDTPGAARMPQLYANLTKNATIPSVHGGALWADTVNKRLYLFGGEYYQQPPSPQFTLWAYDTIYQQWDSFGSPTQDSIAAVSYGAGVSIPELGQGYYYGGWKSSNTMPGWMDSAVPVTGLVKYSMDLNHFSNNTGPDAIGRAEGAMVFIPIGDGGMLVYFGGVQDPTGNGTVVGQPMEKIFLYDVLSSKWYSQNATGAIPQMRSRFCAGATWAADQSSYNIYIYGGAGMPPHTSGFDDVYALTIPSFQYVKIYPTDGNVTGEYPHHSLSCNIIDGAQMIVIGGTFPTSDRCDVPEQYGVHNVDLGQQNPEKAVWQIFSTNITKYAVPDPIISAIGGSAGGGATKTAPADGFNDPDLRVLMTRKANIPARTPTRSIPTATGTPSNDRPLSNGAIAGIAVAGAVVLLAAVIGLVWFIRRRRNPQGRNQGQDNNPPSWSPPGASSTTYSPNRPQPHSPFLQQQYSNGYVPRSPAELPGGGSWIGPDGVVYEAMTGTPTTANTPSHQFHHSHNHHHHPATAGATSAIGLLNRSSPATDCGSGNGSGTGTDGSAGSTEPQTKIDAEGRLWVQVSALAPSALSASAGRDGGLGSRGGGVGGSPRELYGDQQQQQGQGNVTMEPQELSTEPQRAEENDGALGAGAAHGRPRHQTFYHP